MINHVPGLTIRPLNSSEKSTVMMLDATNGRTRQRARIMSLFVDNSTLLYFLEKYSNKSYGKGRIISKIEYMLVCSSQVTRCLL